MSNISRYNHFTKHVRGRLVEGSAELDSDITIQELRYVLEKTKSGKSPGVDGLPYEFYSTFFYLIGETMIEMINSTMGRGALRKSQGLAVIKLIPKLKCAIKPSDFRPISLLCTDYKLIAGELSKRLKLTLERVIGESQRGGVPGRKIVESLTLFHDIIERVNELEETSGKMGATLVAIDLEKAYDYVDRDILWRVMGEMGYSCTFIQKLKTMYNLCEMRVLNGGDECGTIRGNNSIRQGCPLSMHLFVVFI